MGFDQLDTFDTSEHEYSRDTDFTRLVTKTELGGLTIYVHNCC